ncbi:hypothetical protein ACFL6M_04720 [Candidatus Eisenbacteria bacterium]|uniref:Uncharacterized protein n=1 Tax=Eiseniibacteriota bacterium TaxID=2212470 RepID=A0ABV6YKM9_UNCEI
MTRLAVPVVLGVAVLIAIYAPPSVAQIGAFCFPDCSCVLMIEEECTNAGGTWFAIDSCDPNPCTSSVPEPADGWATWGRIKSWYG